MKENILKLRKVLLSLAEISTEQGLLIYEGELNVGTEVFIEADGEFIAPADGEYVAEDKIIIIADGKVAEIKEKEQPEEEPIVPEVIVQEAEEEPEVVEVVEPEEVRDLEKEIEELKTKLEEKDAKIAELEAIIDKQNAELQMSSDVPATEREKNKEVKGALRFFQK